MIAVEVAAGGVGFAGRPGEQEFDFAVDGGGGGQLRPARAMWRSARSCSRPAWRRRLGILNDMFGGQMFAPGGDVGGFGGEVDAFQDVVDECAEAAGVDRCRRRRCSCSASQAWHAGSSSARTSWPVRREKENWRRAVRSTGIGATSRGMVPPPSAASCVGVVEQLAAGRGRAIGRRV